MAMPVQIGAKVHNFSDPTGMLSDCHRRIEMFTSTLNSVAGALDKPPTAEIRRALDAALSYFRQAAPKHTADEEESLFPRLRRIKHLELASAFAKLEELEAEHQSAAPLHARIERLGTKYLSSGNLDSAEIAEFRAAVASLAAMYARHIRVEDEVIFPLAVRVLSEQDKSAIAAEMARRRRVTLAAESE